MVKSEIRSFLRRLWSVLWRGIVGFLIGLVAGLCVGLVYDVVTYFAPAFHVVHSDVLITIIILTGMVLGVYRGWKISKKT